MGFDGMVLKSVLESFVDDIAEESTELILERPRYAYAVVVIADDNEICQASCVRQLDVEIFQTQNSVVDSDLYDSKIERALRELTESRDLLGNSEQYSEERVNGEITSLLHNNTTKHLMDDINRSAKLIKRSAVQNGINVCTVALCVAEIGALLRLAGDRIAPRMISSLYYYAFLQVRAADDSLQLVGVEKYESSARHKMLSCLWQIDRKQMVNGEEHSLFLCCCITAIPTKQHMILTVLLIIATVAAAPPEVVSKSKCEYFLQKIPGMNPLVLTDKNGKKCRGVLEIPVCRGYCKTSEVAVAFSTHSSELILCKQVDIMYSVQ
ncbi:unnamed protein product [Nippostrongylus brasiliensis]|uniref:Secreted protein n=1 Tax=Nippostrongylus brasiliensis TaxID=27835 RepID=A0A0N4YER8_NIPBR|nr:unnamed protein product [Nippostrongylus brasiliensis]